MSSNSPVTIYSADYCPFCRQARSLLDSKSVEYRVIDVLAEPEKRAEMQQRTGRTSVPQIFIGEKHVGGCDDLFALEQQQLLDPLLAASSA